MTSEYVCRSCGQDYKTFINWYRHQCMRKPQEQGDAQSSSEFDEKAADAQALTQIKIYGHEKDLRAALTAMARWQYYQTLKQLGFM